MSEDDIFGDLFGEQMEQVAAEASAAIAVEDSAVDSVAGDTKSASPPEAGQKKISRCCVVFDIETGPRPWEEIEVFYEPPQHPGEFDEASVKYGNTKDKAKRAEKLAEAKEKHAALVAKWEGGNEEAKAKFLSEAALSPITGQVLAIGYADEGDARGEAIEIDTDSNGEEMLLAGFWGRFGSLKASGKLIGFNSSGFDLPFLVRRSWLLGVEVPGDVIRDCRYWHRCFVDLMQVWGCGIYGERIKLDRVALFFGGPRKTEGISGADFSRLYLGSEEERKQAINYLADDLRATVGVAIRMGVM